MELHEASHHLTVIHIIGPIGPHDAHVATSGFVSVLLEWNTSSPRERVSWGLEDPAKGRAMPYSEILAMLRYSFGLKMKKLRSTC